MHPSDRRALTIIIGGLMLIGGAYLLFSIFGDSYLIAFVTLLGCLMLFGLIVKYFVKYDDSD